MHDDGRGLVCARPIDRLTNAATIATVGGVNGLLLCCCRYQPGVHLLVGACMKSRHDSRRTALAKIHIAKKELALDEETYRAMLWTVSRVKSSADLDTDGMQKLLEHMKSRGFVGKKSTKTYPGRPHNADGSEQMKKVEALLADSKLPWSYADAMARRMFKVEKVAWCKPDQLQKLIAALTYSANRKKDQA